MSHARLHEPKSIAGLPSRHCSAPLPYHQVQTTSHFPEFLPEPDPKDRSNTKLAFRAVLAKSQRTGQFRRSSKASLQPDQIRDQGTPLQSTKFQLQRCEAIVRRCCVLWARLAKQYALDRDGQVLRATLASRPGASLARFRTALGSQEEVLNQNYGYSMFKRWYRVANRLIQIISLKAPIFSGLL